jgi:hypothetical protein
MKCGDLYWARLDRHKPSPGFLCDLPPDHDFGSIKSGGAHRSITSGGYLAIDGDEPEEEKPGSDEPGLR